MSSQTSYDRVPYESLPFPQTHPDRLAVLGRLFDLTPPTLTNCRVLELGCAAGGNLIPMAVAMPHAEFVGIDLSRVQVDQGRATIDALGLSNIRLYPTGITELDESFGNFDYILCHGVYSWVPDPVQEKILDIIARQLRDQGIAYVSYNALPGWRMRGAVRDIMRYHAMQFDDPVQRVGQARAILDFLTQWVPSENNPYGVLLQSELETLSHSPDYYILHEHLEDINEPLYFYEFVERAGRHGLQYLAEADFSTMLASNFPKDAAETLWKIAPDVIRQEQFMDFLRNRTFRQTLLVHDGRVVNRTVTPDRIRSLWLASSLKPVRAQADIHCTGDEEFRAANGGGLRTPNPVTKAAIRILADRWPASLAYSDLLEAAVDRLGTRSPQDESILTSDLLQCFAAGLLELHAMPAPYVTEPGERPRASPLARLQASRGLKSVTNLRHEILSIDDGLGLLLHNLDGSHGREEIFRLVASRVAEDKERTGRIQRKRLAALREQVDHTLMQVARAALLLA